MTIHLIHGIHTAYTDHKVSNLATYLKKSEANVKIPCYGYLLAVESRTTNPRIVSTLLPYIEQGDIIVGHSNGCDIALELAIAGAPVAGMVFINAALERDIKLPLQVNWLDVYFNDGDNITELAEIAAQLLLTPVDINWGQMGHAGYSGDDKRIVNLDCGNYAPLPVVNGHGDLFSDINLPAWGAFITNRISKCIAK